MKFNVVLCYVSKRMFVGAVSLPTNFCYKRCDSLQDPCMVEWYFWKDLARILQFIDFRTRFLKK